jgi:hypothetical protein
MGRARLQDRLWSRSFNNESSEKNLQSTLIELGLFLFFDRNALIDLFDHSELYRLHFYILTVTMFRIVAPIWTECANSSGPGTW